MFLNKKRIAVFLTFIALMFVMTTFAGAPAENAEIATRMVTFTDSYNGQDIMKYRVEVGKSSQVPNNPEHENFIFSGWYQYDNRDVKIESFDRILNDIHVIALYDADINNNGIADDVDTYYNVRFVDGVDKTELKVDRVLTGKDATAPLTVDHNGYTFAGWDVDFTKVEQDLVVTANYINNNVPQPVQVRFYNVTFVDGEDNSVIQTVTVQEGFSATAPTAPKHQKKVFDRWDGAYTNVRNNRTVTARYADDLNSNGVIDSREEHFSVEFTALENGSLEGKTRYDNLLGGLTFTELGIVVPTPKPDTYYVFDKWDKDIVTTVNGSATYKASFMAENDENENTIPDEKEYRVITYTDGVEEDVFEDKVFDKALDGLDTPLFEEEIVRENYIFNGWNPEVSEKVNGNKTYVAVWLEDFNNNEIPDKDELVAIKYNAGELGTINGEVSYVTEQVYVPGYSNYPEAPTVTPNDNYKFKEWTPTYSTENIVDTEVLEFTAIYYEDKNDNNVEDSTELVAIIYYAGERGNIDGNRRLVTEEIYLPGFDKYPEPPTVTVDDNYKFKAWDPTYDTNALIDADNLTFTGRYFKDRNDNNIDDEEEYINVTFYAGDHGRINGGKSYTTPGKFLANLDYYPEAPEVEALGIYKFKEWTPNYSTENVIDANSLSFTATYYEDKNDNNIDDETELVKITFNAGTYGTINGEASFVTEKAYLPQYAEDTYPEAPEVIANNGYTFAGWDPEYVEGNIIDKDKIVFNAKYDVDQFTITYKDGVDGTIFPDIEMKVNYNEPTPLFGEDPIREKYVFAGWDKELVEHVVQDDVYNATWKTDEIGDGAPDGVADENQTYTLIVKHVFSDDKVTKEDITIEKDYNNRTFTVTPEEVAHYTVVEDPIEVTIGDDYKITKTVTFHYTRNSMEVSYKITGDVTTNPEPTLPEKAIYEEEDLVTIAKPLEIAGYTFSGWMIDGEPAVDFNAGNTDVVITGSFTKNTDTTYKVKYYYQDAIDGTYKDEATEEVERTGITDDKVTLLEHEKMPNVVKYGNYAFDSEQENVLSGNILGDGTFELKVYFKKQFTVTYKDGVDEEVFENKVYATVNYNDPTPEFGNDPVRENYIFGGWGTVADKVVADVTYTAVWIEDFNNNKVADSEELVAIKFNAGDHGTINGEATYVTEKVYLPGYSNYPEAPTITPEVGYKTNGFVGYTNGMIPMDNPTVEFTGSNEIITFTVKFVDYNDEVIGEVQTVNYGEDAVAPLDPVRDNYTFAGWDKTFTNVLEDLTVKAKYTANQIGIVVEEKPNQNWVFQKNQVVDLNTMIDVYEKYADGSLSNEPVTNYETDFSTTELGKNITLTVTQNGFSDTSIKYKVQNDEASQSKFEVKMSVKNTYVKSYYGCTSNCENNSRNTTVTLPYNFVEIIEHYDEDITIESAKIKYVGIDEIDNLTISERVRWSRHTIEGYYDPVRIASSSRLKNEDREDLYVKETINNNDSYPSNALSSKGKDLSGKCKQNTCEYYVAATLPLNENNTYYELNSRGMKETNILYNTRTADVVDDDYQIETLTVQYNRTGYGKYVVIFEYDPTAENEFIPIDEIKLGS